jgi:hypothetical protein
MDSYDSSAEYLRSRVEQMAQEISQRVQTQNASGGAVQPFFICDIVNGVENAVAGVVNATHDAVNAAVNATHDVVNAVAHVGERAIAATENAVHAVTAHTAQVVQVANFATDAIKVTAFVTEITGGILQQADATKAQAGTQASATDLIQARRTVIMQQRTSISNDIASKRSELKAKIAAVAAKGNASTPNT